MMSKIIKVKSGAKLESIVGYSRAIVIDNHIYMSNTAGRNFETQVMLEDFKGQAQQAICNVEGGLKAVGASLADIVAYRALSLIPRI